MIFIFGLVLTKKNIKLVCSGAIQMASGLNEISTPHISA